MQVTRDLAERFWPKVLKTDGCWLWQAAKLPKGYGRIGIGGKYGGYMLAHRASWELHFGKIPERMFVCHRCDTTSCVRPDHLFLGTQRDNMLDCHNKGRHGLTTMTAERVRELRQRRLAGTTLAALAVLYGISKSSVAQIARRLVWQYV